MREIKFRVWDKENNEMICNIENKVAPMGDTLNDWIDDERFILMQYTGLKDSKGVEIYEGDIVNFNGIKVAIEWNEAEGCFWGGSNKQRHILQWADMLEIIGNIYANPELLNV